MFILHTKLNQFHKVRSVLDPSIYLVQNKYIDNNQCFSLNVLKNDIVLLQLLKTIHSICSIGIQDLSVFFGQ